MSLASPIKPIFLRINMGIFVRSFPSVAEDNKTHPNQKRRASGRFRIGWIRRREVAAGERVIDHAVSDRQFLIRSGAASARRNGRSSHCDLLRIPFLDTTGFHVEERVSKLLS